MDREWTGIESGLSREWTDKVVKSAKMVKMVKMDRANF